MVKKKRQSKRTTLKDKYKVQRKVRQHKAKERRASRKRAKAGVGMSKAAKLRKDPGIPNLWPFKEQLLQKIVAQNEREQARKEKRIEERRARRSGPSAADLAAAAARSQAFEAQEEATKAAAEARDSTNAKSRQQMLQYVRDLKEVIGQADVILQVLDARDPEGCRSKLLEDLVLNHVDKKRLVLVLNKVDLVPKQNVEEWLTYIRSVVRLPALAFKASTQQQRSNLGRTGSSTAEGSGCFGADALIQLLKNYSRNNDVKMSITVGVVGFPNVGKSSIINSLKRSRAVGVSPKPGFTKSLQVVHLDKKVKLIDSPGVVMQTSGGVSQSALVLRNCVDFETLGDIDFVGVVENILLRAAPERLMEEYRIARFTNATEFLVLVAQKRGKLLKGGVPDQVSAAKMVIHDWNDGKIPFCTAVPKHDAPHTVTVSANDVEMADAPQVGGTAQPDWIAELGLGAGVASEELSGLGDEKDAEDFVMLQ